jgi:hypothetical protein
MKFSHCLLYCGICLTCFCVACATGRITISVLKPAELTVPASLKSISVLPEPAMDEPDNNFDGLTSVRFIPGTDIHAIQTGFLDGAFDVISNSPRFQRVIMADTTGIAGAKGKPLSWGFIRRICKQDTTDGVLVLNRITAHDKLGYTSYFDYDNLLIADYTMITTAHWSIYMPKGSFQPLVFDYTDTLSTQFDLNNTDIDTVLYKICYQNGGDFATRICPFWENDVERVYFTGPGMKMYKAAGYAYQNQWKQAGIIWDELAKSKHPRLASHASFNLALAWERDDNLEQAKLWIDYADSMMSSSYTREYKKILSERLKNRKLLDQQMKSR